MINKKLITSIIVFILIILVVLGLFFLIKKQKTESNETIISSNKTEITIKGYSISIYTHHDAIPSDETYFTTSFDIIDEEKRTNTYYVDFVDLKLFSDDSNNEEIVYDFAKPEEVTISGKQFEYYLDNPAWNAELYYKLPDGKGQLFIKVRGGSVFTSEGDQLKTLALINRSVLESAELADVLNFYIK